MSETASSVQQIVLLIFFVLPGITYQFVRERLRGPAPGEQDLGERVLRAVTASIVLDALYLIIAGPLVVSYFGPSGKVLFAGFLARPRQGAALALVMFVLIPGGTAALVAWRQQRRTGSRFTPVPTAWDGLFAGMGPCFVRAKLKSGGWVGGWYGTNNSQVSAFPNPADIYLESAYLMNADGSFGARVPDSGGLYLRMDDAEVIEFVRPPGQPPPAPAQRKETSGGR